MEKIAEHVHLVQYYETDKMGIVHHSNYIRWMEESRVVFLDNIGWDYARLEAMGILTAVVNMNCDFKHPTEFLEKISVRTYIKEFNGLTIKFAYEMLKPDGTLACTGSTTHVFLNTEGRPMRLKREFPEVYEVLKSCLIEE